MLLDKRSIIFLLYVLVFALDSVLNYFFSILGSTLRTTIKDLVLRIRGNKSLKTYAKAKRKGLYYFLRWVLIRNVNNGEIPLN